MTSRQQRIEDFKTEVLDPIGMQSTFEDKVTAGAALSALIIEANAQEDKETVETLALALSHLVARLSGPEMDDQTYDRLEQAADDLAERYYQFE